MSCGYSGRFLHADLTSGESRNLPLPDWLVRDYIGGKGFGAKLLYDLLPAGTDSFSADNVFMILSGPLTGTLAPAMRGCIVTKSPLTHTFLDSYFGGFFAPEMKYCGYDGIIVTGKAEEPCHLHIEDGEVSIEPAKHLWGLDALETNQAIKVERNDSSQSVLSIGQAGENLVRFALVSCEYNRQAGRGGAGAVMGSKNLKAVSARGNGKITVHDPQAFRKTVRDARAELDASEDIQALIGSGTASAVGFANETGLLPSRNFSDGTYEDADRLDESAQSRHLWLKSAACMGCPIRCSKIGAVRSGRYTGTITDIVEYESAALVGSNLAISDIRSVAHLVKLCDRLGLDSMSAGGVIGFAMEAAQKGLIQAPEGMDLEFGNVEAAERLLRAMAHRRGELGELLAQGVRRASERIGPKSLDFANHVKGLESPAWGPRGAPGTGLAFMTADRGGCHQRGLPAPLEVTEGEWEGRRVKATEIEGKAGMLIAMQNNLAGTDTLVKCDFGGMGIRPETYARLANAAAGLELEASSFDRVGERIWNLTRLFNLREGIDPAQDTLPRRFVREPLPSGPYKGHRITEEEMQYMRSDYYALRGWDQEGRPSEDTLRRLGISEEPRFELGRSE
jgi:aldehyde:ferredoxin oxidoreductase